MILGMLKEAEDELSKRVRSMKSKLQEKVEDKSGTAINEELIDLNGLIARLRIIKQFISAILALKYSGRYDC